MLDAEDLDLGNIQRIREESKSEWKIKLNIWTLLRLRFFEPFNAECAWHLMDVSYMEFRQDDHICPEPWDFPPRHADFHVRR